ncbi:MAG: type II toxin-antitoxin system HicA family toxin [Bacteroidales bacterium]|nr:type II toxin-antitoxin system HicA family toxin [Bacteroidales bacterium]
MSRNDKLIERFKTLPTDFTFEEMVKLLAIFGYELENKGKTSGSRVEFHHDEYQAIMFHKPHPSNIIKGYVIKLVFKQLKNNGCI